MRTFKERISDISCHLQSLMAPDVFPEVQEAVERKDRNLLVKALRKAKIPDNNLSTFVSILFNASTLQPKWPAIF